jgi:hypothetical protein
MHTIEQERYIFYDLAHGDMIRTKNNIARAAKLDDKQLVDVLCRDAIISYCRPFSHNNGKFIPRNLVVPESFIPRTLRARHKAILSARNDLIAHLDLSKQSAALGPDLSYSVKGYELMSFEDRMPELEELANAVEGSLLKASAELRSGF